MKSLKAREADKDFSAMKSVLESKRCMIKGRDFERSCLNILEVNVFDVVGQNIQTDWQHTILIR